MTLAPSVTITRRIARFVIPGTAGRSVVRRRSTIEFIWTSTLIHISIDAQHATACSLYRIGYPGIREFNWRNRGSLEFRREAIFTCQSEEIIVPVSHPGEARIALAIPSSSEWYIANPFGYGMITCCISLALFWKRNRKVVGAMAIRSLSHPGELPAPDMQPGTRLRRSRERLGLTYRDVERASYELACQRGRPDFIVHLESFGRHRKPRRNSEPLQALRLGRDLSSGSARGL